MEASRLTIECRPFGDLKDVIRTAFGARDGHWSSHQLEYLESYLQRGDGRAKTMVIEKPYVDRHYLRQKLSEWVREASSGDPAQRQNINDVLDKAYIGFMTIRPLASAPFGKTILRPYRDKPTRSYIPAEGGHLVHLMGFELRARGLPFQQQEQAVGACATTAIWSAMSRVVRADGGRAPTPYAVTQAATRHYLRDRALPAVSGLELAQLTAAVHEFGYAPYVLKPANEYATFVLSLKSYLLSGIPAVLVIEDAKVEYHAVAASGYRLGDDEEPADDIRVSFPDQGGELRSRGINRLYVHDDRFGPYVRMQLAPPDDDDGDTTLVRIGPAAGDPAQGAGGAVCYACSHCTRSCDSPRVS